jgi:hypothetical protein
MAGSDDEATSGGSSGDAAETVRLKQHVLDVFATFEAQGARFTEVEAPDKD